MRIIETLDSKSVIPCHIFNICKIDGKNKKDIIKLFPTRKHGAYYIDKFINYLSSYHSISLVEYLESSFDFTWPICPISGDKVGYKVSGKGIILSKFKRGKISREHSKAFNNFCQKMSEERVGSGNPMHGKNPWNKGLSKDDNDSLKKISENRIGIKVSKKTRQKLKDARAKHPLKIRHTQKHSEESKQKMREATISRWENGDFSFKKTSIEKRVESWLIENGYKFIYQYSISGFVADFACPISNIVIECHGDFFHCNPNIDKYSIPKYAVQKRNVYRDTLKRSVYKEKGWHLIELWESDINSGEFKDILQCSLKR